MRILTSAWLPLHAFTKRVTSPSSFSCRLSSSVSALYTPASAASRSTGGRLAALLLRLWKLPDILLAPCFPLLFACRLGALEVSKPRCRPLRLPLALDLMLSWRAASKVRADIACAAGCDGVTS
jgi:hypothetical protein